jgi:taurine---2-oxoglutarate transaminase
VSADAGQPFFFTWSAQRGARGVEVRGGDGAWYTTADGGRWLDLGSLSYQANLGHGERRVIEAIRRQADELCLAMPSAVFPAKVALAEKLLALAPDGFTRVFFTLGGAEANENALKIARMVTGRHKLVSRYRSYHGASMGALSLTGDFRRAPLEPGLPGVVHALDCYCDRCPFGKTVDSCARECARHIGEVLELEGKGSVAAVFLEAVPGANGVLVPPPEYWPEVRAACDRHGALLVADEVLTGFGRTGRCFAFEHFDVVPDMITVAKGLTAGYGTLGAVLVHERVARHFDDQVLLAGLTGYAHPLGCAAALAALEVYAQDDLFARAAELEPVLRDALAAVRARAGAAVTAQRGLGLLAALEIDAPPAAWAALSRGLASRRLSLHVEAQRGTAIFAPPLCIGADELEAGVAGFGDALALALAGDDEDKEA